MAKILLIEDDPDQIELYQTVFEMAGLTLIVSANGLGGLSLIKEEKPDLILCDILLPDEDGMEILTKLKKDSALKNIPIAMLTNLNKKDLAVKALAQGAIGFWAKTEVTPMELTQKIKKVLKIK